MLRYRHFARVTVAAAVSLSLSIGCSPVDPGDDGDPGGSSTAGDGEAGGDGDGDGLDGAENLPWVGLLTAQRVEHFYPNRTRSVVNSFSLRGVFSMPNPNREPNPNYTVERVGECTIATHTKGSPASPVDYLDPGDPGTASIGTTAVNLNAGDTRSGHYGTDESVLALYDLGFDAGETVTFNFPGGETIAAFSGSIDVPSEFVLLAPDPADDSITYENGSALNVEWEPDQTGSETEGDTNSTTTHIVIVLSDGLNEVTVRDHVSIVCGVEDTGSFTLSVDVMAGLPDREPDTKFLISVSRVRKRLMEVELADGRKGMLRLEGRFYVSGEGIRRR